MVGVCFENVSPQTFDDFEARKPHYKDPKLLYGLQLETALSSELHRWIPIPNNFSLVRN